MKTKKSSGYEKTIELIKTTRDMPAEEAIVLLIKCAKKGFALASEKAVHLLAQISHPTTIPSLISLYEWVEEDPRKRDSGCIIRQALIEVLGDAGSAPAYLGEIVKPYLMGEDEYLSAITALSLAEYLGTKSLDLLQEAIEKAPDEAKEAVVIAISTSRCNKARDLLLSYLKHPNEFVRRGAKKGLESYL